MSALKETLYKAQQLLVGDRNEAYGDPAECLQRAAIIASAAIGQPLDASDVTIVMMAVKLARHANAPKADNMVDIAAYADIVNYIEEAEL